MNAKLATAQSHQNVEGNGLLSVTIMNLTLRMFLRCSVSSTRGFLIQNKMHSQYKLQIYELWEDFLTSLHIKSRIAF
jgi:hypothetical protein